MHMRHRDSGRCLSARGTLEQCATGIGANGSAGVGMLATLWTLEHAAELRTSSREWTVSKNP